MKSAVAQMLYNNNEYDGDDRQQQPVSNTAKYLDIKRR